MNKILNNFVKGLLVALVVVFAGGAISLKFQTNKTDSKLILISSSLANTLKTNNKAQEENNSKEEVVEVDTENFEINDINIEKEKENNLISENDNNKNDDKSNNNNNNENNQVENNPIEENPPAVGVVEESKPENKDPEITIKGEYTPNLTVASTITPLATYTGRITAYGPDCYGCTSGKTASGQYVKDGNIYYNDATFGNIRIVAADSSIPFGTIVKISGLNISNDPILAIVLDRGGAIGFAEGKHAYFDLLYKTEADASTFGRPMATFEILRNGY